jgi:hypothetical protein
MPLTDRRTILRAAATLPVFAGAASHMASAETASTEAQKPAAVSSVPPPNVTKTLAHYVVTARYDELPQNVRKEGVRTLLNWVGVAIGGSRHQTQQTAKVMELCWKLETLPDAGEIARMGSRPSA